MLPWETTSMRYVAPTSSVKSGEVWLASLTGLPVGMDGGYETTMNTHNEK